MYKIISIISYIIRLLYSPNTFVKLFATGTAELMNYTFGFVFGALAYKITGLWYDKKDYIAGCIVFFINYFIISYVFLVITYLTVNTFIITISFILFLFILSFIEIHFFMKNKIIF